MRVKLSYTVDEEDILPEAAKILGLAADDVKQAIELFQSIQNELSGQSEIANTSKAVEMLDELRKALLAVDTRAVEVLDIVEGYEDYKMKLRSGDTGVLAPPGEEGTPE